jgi:hypothetical protein
VAFSRFKDTIANRVLDLMLGDAHDTTAMPATVYVALITTAPTDANGTSIVEVSTTSTAYARVSVANTGAASGTNWPNAAGRVKSNGTTITYPTSTASWGTVVGAAFYDAATTGNFLGYAALSSSQAVASGVTPQFGVAAVTVTSPGT